jgi:DNA-binding protein H-NS
MDIMAKSYAQVMDQIEALKQQAERMRKGEIAGVIKRIREAISTYGLTASDLGLTGGAKAAAAAPAAAPAAAKTRKPRKDKGMPKVAKAAKRAKAPKAAKKTKAGKKPMVVKFSNGAGGTWGGLGKRPDWLRAALAAGKQLSDFAVK